MLPSTNLFKSIYCPYYQVGFCQRPYCHFKDEKLPSSSKVSSGHGFPTSESRKRSFEEKLDPVDSLPSYPSYTPTPSYCPTPLALLAQISRPTTNSGTLISSRISRQEPPTVCKKQALDTPAVTSLEESDILGDLDDLSDEEESVNASGNSSDLLTNILLNGKKSGVLGNVDAFELEVSKTKLDLIEKREQDKQKDVYKNDFKNETPLKSELEDINLKPKADKISIPEENNLNVIQSEIEHLELRRKLMEDYFRSKNMIGPAPVLGTSIVSGVDESKADHQENKPTEEKSSRSHKNLKKKHDSKHRSHSKSKSKKSHDENRHHSSSSVSEKTHKNRHKTRKEKSENKKSHRHSSGKNEDNKSSRRSKHEEKPKDKCSKSKGPRRKESEKDLPPDDEDVLKFLAEMSKLDRKNSLNYDPFVIGHEKTANKSSEGSSKSVRSIDSPLPDFNDELNLLPNEIDSLSDRDRPDSAESNRAYFDDETGSDLDENEVDEDQLREIFEEFNPEAESENPSKRKANQLESQKEDHKGDSHSLLNKKRVAHSSSNSFEPRYSTNLNRRATSNPSRIMMERYKKIQEKQDFMNVEAQLEHLMEGKSTHVAEKSGSTTATISGTSKTMTRVAHTPTVDANRAPKIVSDGTSKVPFQIRQRYLNTFVQECLQIYHGNKECGYERAVSEELSCYKKAPNRQLYLNIAVNCIKRLRSEVSKVQPSPSSSNGRYLPGGSSQKPQLTTTHLQILAGKPGTLGSWSIEKKSKRDELDPDNFSEEVFVIFLRRYLMTNSDLESNGYPVEDPNIKGGAIVNSKPFFRTMGPQPENPFQRRCDRCGKIYSIDERGHQTEKSDNCIYHFGRIYTNRGNRATGHVSNYSCCNGDAQSDGCQVHSVHVSDILELKGFVRTRPSSSNDDPVKIYALDCEMCSTTIGNELTRVTIINWEGKTVYESLVRPDNDIVDYNTRFSGVCEGDLEGVKTNSRDVQAVLLSLFSDSTILIGHSLESDLKALRILHGQIVDTSVVFPHKMGPPYKRALRNLASEYLQRIIQSNVGGHDSAEDALACLDLMRLKVKQDIKKMIILRKKEAAKN